MLSFLVLAGNVTKAYSGETSGQLNVIERKCVVIDGNESKQNDNEYAIRQSISISSDTVKYVGVVASIILPFILLMIGWQVFRSYVFEKEIRDTRNMINDEYEKMKKIRSDSEAITDEIKTKFSSLQDFVGTLATDIMQEKSSEMLSDFKTEIFSDFKKETGHVIAEIKLKDKDLERGIELMKKLEALDLSLTPTVYKERGLVYFSQGNYIKAIENFSNALKDKNDDPGLFFHRGLAYQKIDKYYEAINDYLEAIKLNIKDIVTYGNLGICYKEILDYDKSIFWFNKVIEIYPKNITAILHKAIALTRSGKFNIALSELNILEQSMPNDPDLLFVFGQIYGINNQYEKSIEYYKHVLSLNKKNIISSKLNLAEAYLCCKLYSESKIISNDVIDDDSVDDRDKMIAKFLRATASILGGEDYANDLIQLIAVVKGFPDLFVKKWTYDEMLNCLDDKQLNPDRVHLVKKLVLLMKKEIAPDQLMGTN